ncbi:MBL fold metallo-hydrolase [Bacillus horti]|uniref:Phosphoribosyl 1,2-cyclic phosphodiesterase n=1 Tax=Caldalkalibacillus horti TaxID=77523 RepID=A0ABT9W1N0_9BACI|nr:MBL fold metallo-hydrolase [Bacillus horti]MDQ0167144.1 phosphoribosyl 1,2-cyclic phosphodiesterase [Bacillus horti]
MALRYSVLASGSTGNATFVATEQAKIVIDAGLTGKQLEALFAQIGENPQELDAILVTHEHSDHIKGLGVLARRYKIPVYANAKTWTEIDRLCGKIETEQKFHFEQDQRLMFKDLEVHSYGVSHDAIEPMAYCVYHQGKKLSMSTDMGYVSERIKGTLEDSDVIIFESNHDVEMLRMGHYPWNIKRRILGDMGHLSNDAAGEALADIISSRTKKVYLAHLSKDNNMVDLARMTVQQILEGRDIEVGRGLTLHDTYPDKPTKLAVV